MCLCSTKIQEEDDDDDGDGDDGDDDDDAQWLVPFKGFQTEFLLFRTQTRLAGSYFLDSLHLVVGGCFF